MSTSYEPSTDANTAPEFSSASLIGITEGTVVSTVSLFVINAIIFLQLIIIRLIGISKHIYMKSKTAFVELIGLENPPALLFKKSKAVFIILVFQLRLLNIKKL